MVAPKCNLCDWKWCISVPPSAGAKCSVQCAALRLPAASSDACAHVGSCGCPVQSLRELLGCQLQVCLPGQKVLAIKRTRP
jgi:hypothetical protein